MQVEKHYDRCYSVGSMFALPHTMQECTDTDSSVWSLRNKVDECGPPSCRCVICVLEFSAERESKHQSQMLWHEVDPTAAAVALLAASVVQREVFKQGGRAFYKDPRRSRYNVQLSTVRPLRFEMKEHSGARIIESPMLILA